MPAVRLRRFAGLALAAAFAAAPACGPSASAPLAEPETSLYTLVTTIDGTSFYPPLGPAPTVTGAFDPSLLGALRVVLEATSASGAVTTVASFDQGTATALRLVAAHEVYFVDVPAAAYFTDPSRAYRFRALLGGVEIGRSDLSGVVFDVLARNPALTVGVKLRIERRDAPTLSALAPSRAVAGDPDTTLTVTGAHFAGDSVVHFAGQALATTRASATTLTALVPAALLAQPGSASVVVTTPAPGGGTSGALAFAIDDPTPVLSALSPARATEGGPDVLLALEGDWLTEQCVVRFDAHALATTFVDARHLRAVLPAALVRGAGLHTVDVVAGARTSLGLGFTVVAPAPVPQLAALAPTSMPAGNPAFVLTVLGAGFAESSEVTFAGSALATTYVSATELRAAVPATSLASAGQYDVLVSTPPPGGGTSATLGFTITGVHTGGLVLAFDAAGGGTPPFSREGCAPSTWPDRGPNHFDGAISGCTASGGWRGTGVPAEPTRYQFDGSSAVTVANNAALDAPGGFSLEVWINPSNLGADPMLVSKMDTALRGYYLQLWRGTFILATNGNTYERSARPLANGTWYQLVVTYDGTTKRYYVNGTLTDVFHDTSGISASSVPLTLSDWRGGYHLAGAMPVVAMWNRVVSDAEIMQSCRGNAGRFAGVSCDRPVPTLSAVAPASANVGAAALTLTVDGAGFVDGAVVRAGATALTTRYVSPSRLEAEVPAGLLASAATLAVTVENPAPTAGPSAALDFVVYNPAPALAGLSPSSALAGSGDVAVTLAGASFVSGASARFGGAAVPTTFVSSAALVAIVPASLVASAASLSVTVANPAPAPAASGAQTFVVNNPAPVLASFAPASATAGAAGFALTVSGASFVPGALVSLGGAALSTAYASATELVATVPALAIAAGGQLDLSVSNPAPSLGASATRTFTVSYPVPAIAALTPAVATAGAGATTLTLDGTGFFPASTVAIDGATAASSYVSPTRLTATLSAATLASARTLSVTVSSPAPGGGTSAAVSYTVQTPAPVVGSLAPASAVAGGAGFTLTIDGASFVAGATAVLGTTSLATTFVSASRLTAIVPASAIAAAGSLALSVANPAPSAGASNVLAFAVNNGTPVIATLTPASVTAGDPAFTLTVAGSGFQSGATVTFGAAVYGATFVSSSELRVAIPASAVSVGGLVTVSATNPAPTAGPSNAASFTIVSPANVPPNDAAHPALGCVDLLEHGAARSGLYWIDPNGGSTSDEFLAWCDMDSDGGGWMLVAVLRGANTWAAGETLWHSPGTISGLTPTSAEGVSVAWQAMPAAQLSIHTHGEAEGRWASFDLPSAQTMLALVGTTNINAVGVGTYRATITPRAQGAAANTCFNQAWRVTWRDYWSGDNYPDSAIFAPSGAATGRPCGGNLAWATGIGAKTDTSNGFSGYGGSFEGYGGETYGNAALTGGQVSLYVRERTPVVTQLASALPHACSEVGSTTSGFYTIDPTGGDASDAMSVYCDMTTAGGGWTLVMVTSNATAWAAGSSIWHTADGTSNVGPNDASGKSYAYAKLPGQELMFRTHSASSTSWATFRSTKRGTLRDLVGADNIQDRPTATVQGYLLALQQGPTAHACFAQDWRVGWRDFYSSDSTQDSAIFAPGGAATGRPCGGSSAYATGIGVRTDTSNGFSGYGGSFEGYGADGLGNAALTGGYVAIYVREGSAPAALPTSCAGVSGTTSGTYLIDPNGGAADDAFPVYCDMTTDGGGWTLVTSIADTGAFAAGNAIWHDTSAQDNVVPTYVEGKTRAYASVPGTQLLFRFNREAAGNWASFDLPTRQTVLDLVGTTNVQSVAANTPRATITPRNRGAAAATCLNQSWRVTWRDYYSSDNLQDSSIFAPSGAATGRPCGGSTAYATGIGVRTDTSNGWSGYGASFEGYGADTGGSPTLTRGHVTIYVR